ncbi:tetratricopeptide repeat protein 22-like [Ptychodera flava]|uniref:tetratricopeptide repeat protein 22-like n=1 Tax=Ptychodera flava TaxID=63121 RepID=UPI003969DAC0
MAIAVGTTEVVEKTFGLLSYDKLAINTKQISTSFVKQLETRYDILKQYHSDGCPTAHQNIALLLEMAACAYRLHKSEPGEDPEEMLVSVLEEEPNNLNALADLTFVYEKTYQTSDAQRCQGKLERLTGDQMSEMLRAKSFAERAFVRAHDVHTRTRSYERYCESNKLYEEAISLASSYGENVTEDICAWHFVMGENYRRIYNIMTDIEQPMSERIVQYDRAAECYYEALKTSNAELKSELWCSVGLLFCKKPKLPKGQRYPHFIGSCAMLRCFYHERPLECFKKALETNEDSLKIKTLYGWHCHRLGKKEEGMEILNEVIKADPDNRSNWYAYSCRSKINRVKYREQHKNKRVDHKCEEHGCKELLMNALSDSQKCIKMNKSPQEYAHLAEIHHLLAVFDKTKINKKEMKNALKYFALAEDCQDGAERPDIHQRRALCLQDNGQSREAIEHFKRAFECASDDSRHVKNFTHLMEAFFREYRNKTESCLLAEIAHWFKRGVKRYKNINIDVFNEDHANELLELGKYLLGNDQLVYAKRCFSALRKYCNEETRCKAKSLLHETQTRLKEEEKTQTQIKEESECLDPEKNQEKPEDVQSGQDCDPDHTSELAPMASRQSPAKLMLSISQDQNTNTINITSPDGDINSQTNADQFSRPNLETLFYRTLSQIDGSVRNKPDILPTLENPKNKINKLYDFFPIYCKENEEWVFYTLLPKLEEDMEFKGCIADRDFTPGKQILSNITEAIENSACVIAVMSRKFWEDKRCEHTLHQAMSEDDDRVIPFAMEEYDENDKKAKMLKSVQKVNYYKYLDWKPLETGLLERMEQKGTK